MIDDKAYEGFGPNKKQAKNEAAQLALRDAFNMELVDGYPVNTKPEENLGGEFGDYIAK